MNRPRITRIALFLGMSLSTLACGGPAPSEPDTPPAVEELSTATPPASEAASPADSIQRATDADGSTRFDIVEGTRALYRVREQLVGVSFPNDAVGIGEAVEGVLVIRSDGSVDSSRSRIALDLSTFSSDQDRRDRFIRDRVFEVDQHPTAVFVPTTTIGSPFPDDPEAGLPIVGFQLVGDMTVHGVTQEITWDVLATYDDDGVVEGKAQTSFSFSTFDLMQPEFPFLLSVEDEIRLEIDFKARRGPRQARN